MIATMALMVLLPGCVTRIGSGKETIFETGAFVRWERRVGLEHTNQIQWPEFEPSLAITNKSK
jgi:hypothetical protein